MFFHTISTLVLSITLGALKIVTQPYHNPLPVVVIVVYFVAPF